MSAVAVDAAAGPAADLTLELVDARRRLCIQLLATGNVWAAVYPRQTKAMLSYPLASSIARRQPREMEQFSLRYRDQRVGFWVGTACFEVSLAEAQRIASTYLDHGLEIHREVQP